MQSKNNGCLIAVITAIVIVVILYIIFIKSLPKKEYHEPTYREQIDIEARKRMQEENEAEREMIRQMIRESEIEKRKREMKELGY